MPSNGVVAKIILRDLDLLFDGQNLKTIISLKRQELARNAQNDFYIFVYLLTNDRIARFTHNDFDLLFQGKNMTF